MYLEAVGRSGEREGERRESGNCEERERERGTEGRRGVKGRGVGIICLAKRYIDDEERDPRRRAAGGRGRLFKLLPGILAVLPNDLAVRLWLLPPPSAPSHGC